MTHWPADTSRLLLRLDRDYLTREELGAVHQKNKAALLQLTVQLLHIVLLVQNRCDLAVPVAMETGALFYIECPRGYWISCGECRTSLHSGSRQHRSSSTARSRSPPPEKQA